MAREEHDREDLLAEATALVERAGIRIAGEAEVVFGFRSGGSASIYFGAEPVYQFNTQGELRRAFVGDRLYKADAGRLVSLRRERTPEAVELRSSRLDEAAQQELLAEMRRRLHALASALRGGRFTLVGQVPPGADVVGRMVDWLQHFGERTAVATSPRNG